MYRLPLFVLPTVLFPGAHLPLHVFEPRYRSMVARCLESDRRFGVLFHDPDEGGPFVLTEGAVGCVAEIEQFRPLADGRSLMLTRGIARYRVVDGIESDAQFTEALVEDYMDRESGVASAERRQAALAVLDDALARAGRTRDSVPDIDASRDVSFQLAQMIRIDGAWQQRLLEASSEADRLDAIERVLLDT